MKFSVACRYGDVGIFEIERTRDGLTVSVYDREVEPLVTARLQPSEALLLSKVLAAFAPALHDTDRCPPPASDEEESTPPSREAA